MLSFKSFEYLWDTLTLWHLHYNWRNLVLNDSVYQTARQLERINSGLLCILVWSVDCFNILRLFLKFIMIPPHTPLIPPVMYEITVLENCIVEECSDTLCCIPNNIDSFKYWVEGTDVLHCIWWNLSHPICCTNITGIQMCSKKILNLICSF